MTLSPGRAWLFAAFAVAKSLAFDTLAADGQLAPPKPPFTVRWVADPSQPNQAGVEVPLDATTLHGLRRANWKTPEWQALLSIYAEQGDVIADVSMPPVLGKYEIQTAGVRWEAQFPLVPGVTYRAVFRPAELPGHTGPRAKVVSATLRVPRPPLNPTTLVAQVYPSGGIVPENLLKFYVHFSAPMSRGRIYDHIHLRDETGKNIELPFLELDEELWNPAMTRLTLFIDPGRIKRGVLPLEEIGAALEEGKRYTLVIDQAWKDGAGNPLKETFQKPFQVGPPDREPPDPAEWKIQSPRPGGREPLTIAFPEPMDHALAERVIRVVHASGELIEGVAKMAEEERRWTFVPVHPWREQAYQLIVETTIEDLAGNNIGKPFEVDLFEGVQRQLTSATIKLPFEVR